MPCDSNCAPLSVSEDKPPPTHFFYYLVYSAESEGEKKEEKKMCNTVRNVHCMGQKLYVYSPVGER